MKLKLLATILLFVFITGCNTNNNENDLTKDNLKGKVKSISSSSYVAEMKFGEIIKGVRTTSVIGSNYLIKYNDVGNMIQKYSYDLIDNGTSYEFKYNSVNNIIEKNVYDENKRLSSKFKFDYDEKGNLIKRIKYNSDGNVESADWFYYDKISNRIKSSIGQKFYIYKYDNNNNLIEYNGYDGDGYYTQQSTDKDGNITKDYTYYGNLIFTHTYKYNDLGFRIESIEFINDSALYLKSKYKYNAKGNIIEEKNYKIDSSLFSKRLLEYDENENVISNIYSSSLYSNESTIQIQYDKMNNWIVKTIYDNNFPKYIIERKIEYY